MVGYTSQILSHFREAACECYVCLKLQSEWIPLAFSQCRNEFCIKTGIKVETMEANTIVIL